MSESSCNLIPLQKHNSTFLSCNTCKTRKRKCNKQQPKCSLCLSKNLTCEYPLSTSSPRRTRNRAQSQQASYPSPISSTPNPERQDPLQDLSPVPELQPLISPVPVVTSNFPSVLYLDFELSRRYQVEIPPPTAFVSPKTSRLLGPRSRWEIIAEDYFSDTHLWMPIVSKKRFYEHLAGLSSDNQLRADYALLILCMDLLIWVPGEQDPRTRAYSAAKHIYLDLEMQGIVSIQALQAGVLLATYEYGHAIYPSASTSVEACVRYGQLLGINWEAKTAKKPFGWVEAEEQTRLWWSIVMLDRILGIGYTKRSFLTADALPDVCLPSDDSAWDQGIKPLRPPKRVGDPESGLGQGIGRFALAAETVRILGQVHNHVTSDSFGDKLHGEEALLLDRALRALESVVESQGNQHNLSVMNQATMCLISQLMLHEAHASKNTDLSVYFNETHRIHEANVVLAGARGNMPELVHVKPVHICVKETSPFISTLIYYFGSANLRLYQKEGTQETLDKWVLSKKTWREFGDRWKACGAYLKILEAREMSCI